MPQLLPWMLQALLYILGAGHLVEVGHLALGGPGSCTFAHQAGVIGQTFLGSLAASNVTNLFFWPPLWLRFPQRRRISDLGWSRPKLGIGGRGIFQPGEREPEQYDTVTD